MNIFTKGILWGMFGIFAIKFLLCVFYVIDPIGSTKSLYERRKKETASAFRSITALQNAPYRETARILSVLLLVLLGFICHALYTVAKNY